MIAIDTNVLVRLLVDDPNETTQNQLARQLLIEQEAAWVSYIVLIETVWVLQSCYKLAKEEIITVIEKLISHPRIQLENAARVKEFEIILEQTGKLLKKCLKPYFSSSKQVDQLNFKDVFRYAAKHGLLELEEVERWLIYRDNRNDTAHDYGVGFADATLVLLPQFILDAYRVSEVVKSQP